jgi:hypothetical protein
MASAFDLVMMCPARSGSLTIAPEGAVVTPSTLDVQVGGRGGPGETTGLVVTVVLSL